MNDSEELALVRLVATIVAAYLHESQERFFARINEQNPKAIKRPHNNSKQRVLHWAAKREEVLDNLGSGEEPEIKPFYEALDRFIEEGYTPKLQQQRTESMSAVDAQHERHVAEKDRENSKRTWAQKRQSTQDSNDSDTENSGVPAKASATPCPVPRNPPAPKRQRRAANTNSSQNELSKFDKRPRPGAPVCRTTGRDFSQPP